MKNKEGFISMTLVYTFLIVFLFLMASILSTYTKKSDYLEKIDSKIKEEVTLDKNELNTSLSGAWYNLCTAGSTDLKCKILDNNTEFADNVSSTYVAGSTGINFSAISSDTNGKGLYYTTDKTKTEGGARVYYFRGAVTNNYLIFGGYCWRIIRTVEDESIRLRYDGVPSAGTCPQTGASVNIANAVNFNATANDNAYIGYMYGTPGSSTYAATHTNTTSSNEKKIIDAWYSGGTTSNNECYNGTLFNCNFTGLTTKLINYASLIADTPYCSDRSIGNGGIVGSTTYTELGYGQNNTIYAAGRRLLTNGPSGTTWGAANTNPTYICAQKNDKFTVSNLIGNGSLTYPIALLTADEASFAGMLGWTGNTSNYLYCANTYTQHMLTPFSYESNIASVFQVGGSLANSGVTGVNVILPAISLKSTAVVSSGTGTYANPYVVN